MIFITHIADFIVSEWLWNLTWGWHHLFFSFTFLWFFCTRKLQVRALRGAMISLAAHLYSFTIFSLGAFAILSCMHGFSYEPTIGAYAVTTIPSACLYLGVIYTVLESSFFWLASWKYKIPVLDVMLGIVACNMLASALAYYMMMNPL